MSNTDFDKLKKHLCTLVNIGEKVEEAQEDGKISIAEVFSIAWEGREFRTLLSDWEEVKNEYNDLDESERAALIDAIQEELDLENEALENIIEIGLDVVDNVLEFITAIKANKK